MGPEREGIESALLKKTPFEQTLLNIERDPLLCIQNAHTHIVSHCPVLIIVKVDFSFSVCPGEKGMGKDSSGAIER